MDNKQAIKLMKSIRNVYSWSVNCEKALDKAIASLEAWDKVKKDILIRSIIKPPSDVLKSACDIYVSGFSDGLKSAFDIIEEHLKEIEV